MLKVNDLKYQLKVAYSKVLPTAIERIVLTLMPEKSKVGEEKAKEMAQQFDELVSEELAELTANAIDYYIKNAAITGTIITAGSPTTQMAKITSMPTPITNGKVPNTLGIS